MILAPVLRAQSQPITIYPGAAGIPKGTSRQMSAYVPLSPATVTWAINGVTGGNATYGTVTATGLYTAPPVIPPDNLITIRVVSTAYPEKFGTAQISITQPLVYIWGTYPKTVNAGAVAFSVNGAGFVPGVVVTINGQALSTAYVSATSLQVTGNVPASMAGTAKIRAMNPGPGSTTSDALNMTVKASAVGVTVLPGAVTLPINGTQAFGATVSGAANTAVTWSASAGTITPAGLYTAPAALPSPAMAIVTATSAADTSVFATAIVTLSAPAVTVTVSPSSAQIAVNATQQFTAAVAGNANGAVTWSASAGTISAAGLYTAPAALPNPANDARCGLMILNIPVWAFPHFTMIAASELP